MLASLRMRTVSTQPPLHAPAGLQADAGFRVCRKFLAQLVWSLLEAAKELAASDIAFAHSPASSGGMQVTGTVMFVVGQRQVGSREISHSCPAGTPATCQPQEGRCCSGLPVSPGSTQLARRPTHAVRWVWQAQPGAAQVLGLPLCRM